MTLLILIFYLSYITLRPRQLKTKIFLEKKIYSRKAIKENARGIQRPSKHSRQLLLSSTKHLKPTNSSKFEDVTVVRPDLVVDGYNYHGGVLTEVATMKRLLGRFNGAIPMNGHGTDLESIRNCTEKGEQYWKYWEWTEKNCVKGIVKLNGKKNVVDWVLGLGVRGRDIEKKWRMEGRRCTGRYESDSEVEDRAGAREIAGMLSMSRRRRTLRINSRVEFPEGDFWRELEVQQKQKSSRTEFWEYWE